MESKNKEENEKEINKDGNKEEKKLNKEIDDLDKNIDELEKTINDLEIKASSIYDEESLDSSSIDRKLNKKSNLKVYQLIIIGFFISMISILLTKIVILFLLDLLTSGYEMYPFIS